MIMDYDDDDEHYPASPRSALSSSPQQTRGLVPSPPSRRLPAPMLPVLLGDDGSIASTNHTRTSSTRSRVNSIHSQRKISLLTAATAATTLAGTAAAAATATTTAAGGATARVGGAAENNANVNTNMNTPISSRSPIVRTASPKAHRSLSPYQLPPISSNPAMINHRQHSSHPPGRAPFGSASSSPPTLDKRPPPLTGTGTGSRSSRHNAHHAHHLHYDHYDDNNTNHHQPYQPNHQNHQNHQNHHSHQSHQSRQNQHQDLHLPPIKTSIPSTRQLPPLTQIFSASSPPSKSNPIHLPPITATPNGRLPSPTLHRQPIVHPPLQHPPRPPPVRPVRSTSPPEIPPTPIKPSLLPPSQIPPPPPMPPPRPPLVAVPKLTPRHNTEPDPETLTQVLHETRAKLLAENEKAPPEVLRTVRAILDSPAWELNGHPQAAFVQPPHGPPSSSNCPSVNPNTNPNTIPNTIPNPNPNGNNSIPTANININIIANANGTVTTPAAADEISVDALQPLFKAIPYTSKGGKEGSRGGTDKYECLWGGCGKIVKRRDHMVNHVKAHLGIKPFACPFVYEYLDQRQWSVPLLLSSSFFALRSRRSTSLGLKRLSTLVRRTLGVFNPALEAAPKECIRRGIPVHSAR